MVNNRNSAGDTALPAETIAEAQDGVILALDALDMDRVSRDDIRQATGHMRFALRKINNLKAGLSL